MNLKILAHLLLAFLVISCNKKESKTSKPGLVITGSGSANAFMNYFQLTEDGKVLQGSPTNFVIKLYAIYISENEDCTNPIKIADFGAGKKFNLFESPTLFSRELASGTYQCLILKMSDNLSYKVNQDAVAGGEGPLGSCIDTNTIHTGDIHRHNTENWYGLDNDSSDGDSSEQAIYIFASTNVDPDNDSSPRPEIHSSQSLQLIGPLVVPGKAIFYADFTDGIENGVGRCALEKGGFGFR